MTLDADNNTLFGGPLINQKYSPLDHIDITDTDADKKFYFELFNRRITALSRANAFPKKLSLFISTWPTTDVDTAPMVVISSNRAEWIKSLLDNAVKKNRDAAFTGYNDATTFNEGAVAWYDPLRSQRPLFVVVHHAEYAYYKKLLKDYRRVYVVGWQFPSRKWQIGAAGFGASRFAALELVKILRYHKAWMVDDNVVNVNGFPNRLATIEALMSADIWAIGFSAATTNVVYPTTATFTPNAFDFTKQKAGLLQQVALWNLDHLRDNNLNASPYFVASNEDVSLSNYLQAKGKTERIIKSLSIIKMVPVSDKNNTGAEEVGKIKTALLEFLFRLEKGTPIKKGTAALVELGTFVKTTILPNSQYCPPAPTRETAAERSARLAPLTHLAAETQSKAIEQVLAELISKAFTPVKDVFESWPLEEIFDPYKGFEGAKVELLSG